MANQVLFGFMNRRDLLDQRVTDSTIPEFNTAIDETLAEHTRQLNAVMGLFVTPTTEFKERYAASVLARSQPLDENGKALPIKRAGYTEVAYPVHGSGNAWGANYITRAKMTGREVQNILNTIINGDVRWMRDHIIAALTYGTAGGSGWTFTDPLKGALTIQGLANGDSQTYQIQTGSDAGATDTHILAQAAAIADNANPYDDIYAELIEHPENGGEVVAFIPTALKATTEALTAFKDVADPNIRQGVSSDVLVGSLGIPIPGQIIGYVNKVWIVEWKALPATHIIATTTEGDRPLAMRQEPEAELQGFKRVAEGADVSAHPFYESQYLRLAGFGARNRVGAVSYQIGDATYAIPTGYDSPMP